MTDKEKLKEIMKLADAMYYAAFNLTTDASMLRKAMKEYHQFIIHEYCKEELVSNDLNIAARNFSNNIDNIRGSIGEQIRESFKAGAKCQKEQMMAKAVDAHVNYAWSGLSFGGFDWSKTGLDIGDKCKLIIIKED